MRALLINILILGFLLTLYVYVNTDHEKTTIKENAAQTTELEDNGKSNLPSQEDSSYSYKVKEGDTISQLAEEAHLSVKELKEFNGLTKNELSVGEYIEIPAGKLNHGVEVAANDDTAPFGDSDNSQTMTQSLSDQGQSTSYQNQGSSDQTTSDRQAEIEERRRKLLEQKRQMRQSHTTERLQRNNGSEGYRQSTRKVNGTETPKTTETGAESETKSSTESKEPPITVSDGEIVNIQSEMDIQDLIQTISEITGQNFILDESVKGKKITVIAPGGFKKENAMKLFETILSLNGFAVVKKDGTNIIVPKRDIKITSIPTEIGKQLGVSSDSFVTRLVKLKNVQAQEVANILKPLISREGDIVVYPETNTLIIVETVDNLNRILKIIDNLDVETEIEFIKIHNADAADVAAKLVEIFGGTASTTSGSSALQSQQSRRQTTSTRSRNLPGSENRSEAPAISSQTTGQNSAVGFKVITDERTNSLIVIAYPNDMKKIKSVIEILDVETSEPEEGIYVIRVLNADAEQLVSVLASLFGGTGSTGGFGGNTNRSQFSQGSSPFSTNTGSSSSSTFGSNSATSRQPIQRGTTNTTSAVAETDSLRITSDPSTNSIIFIGSRRDYETVKQVIQELDVRRKQVFVEAAILEVSLDKIRSFGTNLSLAFTVNGDTLGFGGTVLPGVPSLLGVAADSNASMNLLGSLSGLFLGAVGPTVDPDGSGPIPPIPSFTALFQALTSLTDVNVLSTPSILTTDNEPAEIIVADVIPFPTGSTVGDSGVTVQTIQREPVGIRLSIVPQISEGDYLNLNILTEVSAIRQAPVQGLNTAQFGIATTTRTADSSIVVKNGQTIVIGGLVQDRESVIQNRVPVLGNIPVLGTLFKFKQRESQKINLMILLTPRIVESDQDMQRILEERQRRNMLLQERGFNKEDSN